MVTKALSVEEGVFVYDIILLTEMPLLPCSPSLKITMYEIVNYYRIMERARIAGAVFALHRRASS